jgi:hypothetical protein
MTKLLDLFGLMRVSEHEALNERFKDAIVDLEHETRISKSLLAEIKRLEPDALAMRRKRQMDRDRKAAKKEGGL